MENTIPERYRNRLYLWQGGGYDGCFWEPNCGFVTAGGQWIPLYSTGYSGMDVGKWFDRKIKELQTKCGRDSSYVLKLAELAERKADAENGIFLDVASGKSPRDEFREIGLLDGENIKETCRKLSSNCGNVGFLASCLDGLQEYGYRPWCKCSDCGEMFRPHDYERFTDVIDPGSYRGNGGCGVVHDRILCERCIEVVTCPACAGFCLPNPRTGDGPIGYSFYERLLNDWLGICDNCSSELLYDKLDADKERELAKVEIRLIDKFELQELKLYDAVVKERPAEINYIRDLVEPDARKLFRHSSCNQDLFEERIKE